MDDEFFIHLLSQCYTEVGEVILLKAIQIIANWRFFLGPSQPIPNSHIIAIVIFIIFTFFHSLKCTSSLSFTLHPSSLSRKTPVCPFLQILSMCEMNLPCVNRDLPLRVLCILSMYLKPNKN